MKRFAVGVLVTLAALAVACASEDRAPRHDAPALGEPVTLGIGEAVAVGGVDLRFDGVAEDSRCPGDAVCIWAGQATADFSAQQPSGAQALSLTLGADPDAALDVLDGLEVFLVELSPTPVSTAPISPDAYRATVVVQSVVAARSGIEGLITLGPLCPVQRADRPCPDRPYIATLVVSDRSGAEVARVTSHGDGRYRLALDGGAYTVTPLGPEGRPLPVASPVDITVAADGWTTLDIAYDTGIR